MFYSTDFLKNDEIYLMLERTTEAKPEKTGYPRIVSKSAAYRTGRRWGSAISAWDIQRGSITAAISAIRCMKNRQYAGKACKLLFELAKMHGMDYLYITCNPENIASRKTCEYAGGKLERIVDLPPDNNLKTASVIDSGMSLRFRLYI